MNIIKSEIKLTKQIWKLTKSGKLKWKLNEVGHYIAKYKDVEIQIDFFNFARMDEQSSDDSCGTVSISFPNLNTINGIIFDFSVGTKQFTNLRKTVFYNKKEWKKREQRFTKRYKAISTYLEKL